MFFQLDVQFSLANITSDSTKFNYVISAVDAEILAQVIDTITNPPTAGNMYETIKNKLISIYGDISEQRLGCYLDSSWVTKNRRICSTKCKALEIPPSPPSS